jgi:hypothetical protein
MYVCMYVPETNYGKEYIYTASSSVISFLIYFCYGARTKNVARTSYTTDMTEQECIQNCGWKPPRHGHTEIPRRKLKDSSKTQHTEADYADVDRTELF